MVAGHTPANTSKATAQDFLLSDSCFGQMIDGVHEV